MRFRRDSIVWKGERAASTTPASHRPKLPRFTFGPIAKIIVIVVLILAGILLLLRSSLFSIRTTYVNGLKQVLPSAVDSVVNAQMEKSRWLLFSQSVVFFFDVEDFSTHLRKVQPKIASVSVQKRFPPALTISVTEHPGVAVWQSQNRFFELNDDGVATAEVVAPPVGQLLMTNSSRVAEVRVGEPVTDPTVLREVEIIHNYFQQVNGIQIQNYDLAEYPSFTVKARTTAGWILYISTHLGGEEQANKLAIFIGEKSRLNKDWQKGINYVDLRFGSTRIYYQ